MKWIGQHIYDLIARFRNDVYLEDISTGTIASGGNLGLDSNNKIVKATEATGDITSVTLGTDGMGLTVASGEVSWTLAGGSAISTGVSGGDTITIAADSASTTAVGVVELATTAETTTGTDTIRVVTPDGLKDGYQGSENVVTVGTITTGVWRGTAIAQTYIAGDAINGDKIADDAVDSEHYTDGSIDTAHVADDAVTFAKASGVTPNVYGSIIKLLPSDFAANDDGGNTKFGIGYVDHAGASTYGMRAANASTELYAFVSIPEGMKATHVDIYDKNDLAIEVFEAQINGTTMTSKGSGNANTQIDLGVNAVNSTATNFLAIQVTTTHATNDLVWGGAVTIAAQ